MGRITDLVGAVTAVAFFASAIGVFTSRLVGRPEVGRWLGYAEFALAFPAAYLLAQAPRLDRPTLYYVQLSLFLAWLAVEALLDYILKLDFRRTTGIVVGYVVLFFAACGGLVGVAAYAGRGWTLAAALLFLVTAVMAFVQRAVTGK